jgi:hypothetical protein
MTKKLTSMTAGIGSSADESGPAQGKGYVSMRAVRRDTMRVHNELLECLPSSAAAPARKSKMSVVVCQAQETELTPSTAQTS